VFICDGCDRQLLLAGCEQGWLPNINERFVRGGTCVENAVSCVPSITYAALTTFLTGANPARHEIVGNQWFDPALRLYRDYNFIRHYRDVNGDFWAPTLYERLRPGCSLSIQSAVHRGVTKNVANWAQSGVRWFFGDYTAVDKLTATTLEYAANWANRNRRWPELLVCYFPGLDSIGHAFGCDSPRYRQALAHLDYQIGRVCDWLEREGLLETTSLVLVSDHGHVPVRPGGVVDIARYLRKELHRRVWARPLQDQTFRVRELRLRRFDTVCVRSGQRFATLHFAGPLGWDDPLDAAAVAELLESAPDGARLWQQPGVELVVYPVGEHEALLRSAHGTARIVERAGAGGAEYRYVPAPDDVLGYMRDPELAEFVAGGFHDSRAWLRATCTTQHPDAVPHLLPLLRSRRTGDVLLFAGWGYSFGPERAGHGGLHRDEMLIPMMFAGPGIEPGGRLEVARAADLLPTLLRLLGREVPDDRWLDGVPLLPAPGLERAGQLRHDACHAGPADHRPG